MFPRYFGLYIGQIYFTLYYLSYFCFLLYSSRLALTIYTLHLGNWHSIYIKVSDVYLVYT